ncbi:MAG: HNH endonuclease [Acidobacteria bacterium]|nr:HNH endonuclease [Acidobacteriota bacterium]
MATVVTGLKKRLEARGECVVMANLDSGWFAVNPHTWQTRMEVARREGRDGPNLVVYRTKSGNPRDHYAIPYLVASGLLTNDTLRVQANGSQRWNLTLKGGRLHVSHRLGSVDVHEFHGAPLMVEKAGDTEMMSFEAAVLASRRDKAGRSTRLAQAPRQPLRSYVVLSTFRRNPDVVAEVLERANGLCERCHAAAPFNRASDGTPYLEVHHKVRLVDNGEDTVENAIALCPNCHRFAHHA